jgi:hypothetical protein
MRPTTLSVLVLGLALSGCSATPPPPPAAAAKPADTGHHELQSAIDAVDHRDKAAAAGDAALDADKAHDKQLEDSGG